MKGAGLVLSWVVALAVACAARATIDREIAPQKPPQPPAPCIVLAPPAAPELDGDEALDRARRAQAYDELERYVRLAVVPCLGR